MTRRETSFAAHLRHFAKSVDIVDANVFGQVRHLVFKYVRDELQAEYFELAFERPVDGQPGLQMFWSSRDERGHTWRLRSDEGSFSNPVTLAVAQQRPLWIVGCDRLPLAETASYVDLWSHIESLPPYRQSADGPVRTVVVVPLKHNRVLGAYFFETYDYLGGITDEAKAELQQLGESLAILYDLFDSHSSHSNMTTEAIHDLGDMLDSSRFPKVTTPHVFVAFSGRADRHVVMVIEEVLDEFRDRIEITNWAKIYESGNVNAQISRDILRSRFGICYLSEPSDGRDSDHKFVDNPNVVFEAGMLHAVTNTHAASDLTEPSGWVPLRESNSPAPPFDFKSERMLEIPRLANGEVNEERLKNDLLRRLQGLLG